MLIQNNIHELFTRLNSKVVHGSLHAHGKLKRIKFYGAVECTMDLSKMDCKNCLNIAINELLDYLYI